MRLSQIFVSSLWACLLTIALWACLLTIASSRDVVVPFQSEATLTCPFMRKIDSNETNTYPVFPTVSYKTRFSGSIYDVVIFSANPDPNLQGDKVDCGRNYTINEKNICSGMSRLLKPSQVIEVVGVKWINFNLNLSFHEAKSTLYCKTPEGFVAPYGGGSLTFTVVDPESVKLVVKNGADRLPGVDEGQELKAACLLTGFQGDEDVPLKIQMSTVQNATVFYDLPIARSSPSEVQLKGVILDKKFRNLKCIVGPEEKPWKVIESNKLQVRYKPYNLKSNRDNPLKISSADGNAKNESFTCSAFLGNPTTMNWTVEAEVDGKLRPDIVRIIGVKIGRVMFDVTVEKDTKVRCTAQNVVGISQLNISVEFRKNETLVNPTPDPLKPWIPTIVSIIVAVHVFIGLLILLVLCCLLSEANNREKESLIN